MRHVAIALVFVACAAGAPVVTTSTTSTATPTSSADGSVPLGCNTPPTSCPNNKTYQCIANATMTSCYYRMSDGTSVACASCQDCSSAAIAAAQWCSQASAPSGELECGPLIPCNTGTATMQMCRSPNQCFYKTSDGRSFQCTTCDDCASAIIAVTTWCNH